MHASLSLSFYIFFISAPIHGGALPSLPRDFPDQTESSSLDPIDVHALDWTTVLATVTAGAAIGLVTAKIYHYFHHPKSSYRAYTNQASPIEQKAITPKGCNKSGCSNLHYKSRTFPCGHAFHAECITQKLRTTKTLLHHDCPSCYPKQKKTKNNHHVAYQKALANLIW